MKSRLLSFGEQFEASQALSWLLWFRLAVLFAVLSVLMFQQILLKDAVSGPTLAVGYTLMCLSFGFNLLYSGLMDRMPAFGHLPLWQIVFDSGITYYWLQSSPGRESAFSLLYLIQILAVALVFYRRWALLAAVAASVGFGILTIRNSGMAGLPVWAAYSVIFATLGLIGGFLAEELHRTAESLRQKSRHVEELTALHEKLIQNMPTGLLTVDNELKIHFVNPAAEQILSMQARDIVGKTLLQVQPGLVPFFSQIESESVSEESDEGEVERAMSATGTDHHRAMFLKPRSRRGKRLQQTVELGRGRDAQVLRGDVAELESDSAVGKLLGEGAGAGKVLLFQDVTKLIHLEEKLKQNEKLAAVGHLAAGIAHEIRNPLASMSASIEMLKGSIPSQYSSEENQKLMDIAIREIDRLNMLVSEFLDFVRPEKLVFDSIDLSALLNEVCLAARGMKEFKNNIEIVTQTEPNVMAHANSSKLKQIIWNLVVNAG